MPDESVPNYPGNQRRDLESEKPSEKKDITTPETPAEKPKTEQIAQGVNRKKSIGRRIFDTFTGDDVHSVGQYVLFEVLIPAAKSTIQDAVTTAIERMMYGDSGRRSSSSSRSGYTSYSSYSKPSSRSSYSSRDRDREEPRVMSRAGRATHNFNEITLPTRSEAEMVLTSLEDYAHEYGAASVADLFGYVGITAKFSDEQWGWSYEELKGRLGIQPTRGGYRLNIPRPGEFRV